MSTRWLAAFLLGVLTARATACTPTAWTSSVTEVGQIGACTPSTCTFSFSEGGTGATVSGTFARPSHGFLELTVTAKSAGASTGWAFSGATLYAIEIPGVSLIVQPLIDEDESNPVYFLTRSCPTANFRANWIFSRWEPGADVNSALQPVAGFLDSIGTSAVTLAVRNQYELTASGGLGPMSLTPAPVTCTSGIATVGSGVNDRSGKMHFNGASGVTLFKTNACHYGYSVPQSVLTAASFLNGKYVGFAYDSTETPGFATVGASVHPISLTMNEAGCTSTSPCSGSGLTSTLATDSAYLSGGFSIRIEAVDTPRVGMMVGTISDGLNQSGRLLCIVGKNLKTTGNLPPFYRSLHCLAQRPGAPSDPLSLVLISVPQASGAIDTDSFNGSGWVSSDFSGADSASDVAIATDGSVFGVGTSVVSAKNNVTLARYKPGGTLDSGFGSGGRVITPILGNDDRGRAVVLQSDGKVVVVAQARSAFVLGVSYYSLSLARYSSTGSLDTSYGTNGISTVLPSAYSSVEMHSAHLLTNDRVLVAGSCKLAIGGLYGFCVARFFSDGGLDTSFGSSGIAFVTMAALAQNAYGYQSRVLSNGKILVVGQAANVVGNYAFALARFNANGTVDTTFNAAGSVPGANTVDPDSYNDLARAIGVLSDGSIVIAGQVSTSVANTNFKWGLAKFSSTGSLDTSFGTAGLVVVTVGSGGGAGDAILDLAVQGNDKVLVVGSSYNGSVLQSAVARYAANGTLDTSFNSTGKWLQTVGGTNSVLNAAALQVDGRLVAGGYVGTNSNDFLLLRLWP